MDCPVEGCNSPGGETCPPDSYCEYPTGTCGGAKASCVRLPGNCDGLYKPVCGCDGQSYGNDCVRSSSGVSKAYDGACQDPPEIKCSGGELRCPAGFFCDIDGGRCQDPGAPGICQRLEGACPDLYAPVCSCDGTTFGNDCQRRAAGAQLAYPGECRTMCGGGSGGSCETPGLGCFCCGAGGPRQNCTCSTSCTSHRDCTDSIRPFCNQPPDGTRGFCTTKDFACCWYCK